jgi:glycosyltransferase involved in cell wall biosynthesis
MSKIAFLLSQSLDSPSGLGRYGPLAKELTKFGHTVDIYALHPAINDLEKRSIKINGVHVHYVAPMHVRKEGDIKSYYSSPQLIKVTLEATWHLSRAAIRNSADIIHICKPHPMNSLAGLLARLINRSDLYLDCDDYESGSGRFSSRWQKSIITWFEKWMPHRVKLVTTNTRFMHDKLISWGTTADNIIYLPNGVDSTRFSSPDPQQLDSLRNELGLEGKKVIGYIGSLSVPSHPVNLLLEAFQQLQELEPNSSLILVGGGEDLTRLKDLANKLGISHATQFCGKVPPESVSLYYSLADVSVDPVYDNDAARGRSPLKLFESWACGVPVVSGDVGDRRNLLGDPPAGILSHPGDPGALSEAIHSILKDPGLADELRTRGLERVKSFTWNHLAKKLNQIYLDHSAN